MKASTLPCFDKSSGTDHLIKINEQVSLHVFEFQPLKPEGRIPVVIITGLVTIIDSFRIITGGLAEKHPVYYIETRDKTSSEITGKVSYDIATSANDIRYVLEKLGVKSYAIIGYSLGGPLIAEMYSSLVNKPLCIIFMEPVAELRYPRWGLFLIRWIAVPFYGMVKKIAKWYLGKFKTNPEDEQMPVIQKETIDNADPVKLRNTILDIAGYKIYDRIKEIKCPSLVVGTSKDGFHVLDEMKKMVELLENGSYIDLETNNWSHNMEMVYVVTDFIGKVTQQSAGK